MNEIELNQLSVSLPHSSNAEQSILGTILVNGALALEPVLDKLSPDDFYNPNNKDIYSILVELYTAGRPLEIVPILEVLRRRGTFDTDEQAKSYLLGLADIIGSVSSLDEYVRIVHNARLLRQLMSVGGELIQLAGNPASEGKELLALAESKLYDLRAVKEAGGLTSLHHVLVDSYDRLQRLASAEDKEELLGIPTGYSALDSYITGLNRSDLILIAARPGLGKTAFALNIAANVAIRKRKCVAVFSLEMGKEQLAHRFLSSAAGVESQRLKYGSLTDADWQNISMATQELSMSSIYVDDTAVITVPEIKARLRRLRSVDLVIIDYLQLMNSAKPTGNRVQEVSELTRSLKIMAKELNIPVITLSQLSRETAKRDDKRPKLSDLRDSGSIEQDADIVLFLHREGYYNPDLDDQSTAQCIIAKNRHGSVGSVDLYWDGKYTRFSTLAAGISDEYA